MPNAATASCRLADRGPRHGSDKVDNSMHNDPDFSFLALLKPAPAIRSGRSS
jgi:hypothetical protein